MPDIPEKYKTLREITEAIAKADDEIIEQHQVSTQRAKRYGRAVIAREEYADAKSLVAERTEKATADFLREAAHHDVKHAIHKAEHRLAEARCQAVFMSCVPLFVEYNAAPVWSWSVPPWAA